MINDYNATLHRDTTVEHNSPIEPVKRKRGRPPKANIASILVIIALLLPGITCEIYTSHNLSVEPWKTILSNSKNSSILKEKLISKYSSILMEKFTYCDRNTDKLLKLDNACLIEHRNKPEF